MSRIISNIRLQWRERPLSLNKLEHDHVQECAPKVDAQSLHWLHSSTSNASVHQSVLQAISGMSSSATRYLPEKYRSALMVSLHQQIERIKPLVPSPGAKSEVVELEIYCRALSLLCGHLIVKRSNEQLKIALYSMTSSEKASSVFLGILQGPLRRSLTLPSLVWKILVDVAVSSPTLRSGVLESRLELMKVLAGPMTTNENEDVTTIDNPTEEVKEHILDKLSVFWGYDRTQMPVAASIHLRAMIVFIPWIQQRLCDPVSASERKQIIETFQPFLDIIEYAQYQAQEIRPILNMLCSLLCSEAFAVVGNLDTLVRRIFTVLDTHQYVENLLRNIRFHSIAYQCYLHSQPGCHERSENDAMLPILKRLLPPSVVTSSSLTIYLEYDRKTLFSNHLFFSVALLLIDEHNESILYEWARHPFRYDIWPVCLPQLVQWAFSEGFRRWSPFLKRVLAIVVIRKLHNMLGCDNDEVFLPRYDYEAHKDVNQPPWLCEISSSGSSREPNAVEYSRVAAHPKFQEFLHSRQPRQEDVVHAASHHIGEIEPAHTS